jgi:hypothetical protein
MKKILMGALLLLMGSVCSAEDITIRYNGNKAKVQQSKKDSVVVTVDGACVNIESLYQDHKLSLRLTGRSDDGQLILKTKGKAKLTLEGLTLTSQEGAPIHLKNKKKVEIVAKKGTVNTLTVTACNDTVNHKGAVIWSKDKLLLSGTGTLNIIATGDGCRGIKSKKDITIEDVTLNVTTSGNNLGEKPFSFGFPGGPEGGFPWDNDSTSRGGFPGFPMAGDSTMRGGGFPGFPMARDSTMRGGFPGGPGGMMPFNFDDLPEEVRQQIEEMRKRFEERMAGDSTSRGGFPGFPGGGMMPFGGMRPEGGDSIDGDFPDFGGGGFAGKHKYVASTKGIASKGKITINGATITVRTSTPGAEGIEGKDGIVFNSGNIDVLSPDDAINAGACIEFNGAHVIARSTGNDAVDSNPKGGFFMPFGNDEQNTDPAIVIRGGTVYAWSQVGSPEEGLDCDFAPLIIEGGNVFSVGGGMGEMPSVPSNENAKQPTVLLIGINIQQDEPVQIYDADAKLITTVTIPFSLRRSASLVTNPAFKLGGTYTVKTKGYEKTFTLNEAFTAVR